jgi:hypothetical protein
MISSRCTNLKSISFKLELDRPVFTEKKAEKIESIIKNLVCSEIPCPLIKSKQKNIS